MEIGLLDIVIFWALMALIWHLGRRSVISDIQQILDQEDPPAEVLENLEIVRDEQGWFSYDSQGNFVAWAPELTAMFEQVSSRYPNKSWHVDGPELSKLSGQPLSELVSKISFHFSQQ